MVGGSMAMEGNGPSMGTAFKMNVIVAGVNPLATDISSTRRRDATRRLSGMREGRRQDCTDRGCALKVQVGNASRPATRGTHWPVRHPNPHYCLAPTRSKAARM